MAEKIKSAPMPKMAGYPAKDVNRDGVMSKGRWINNPGTKTFGTVRGAGAATSGKKFLDN